MAQTDFQLSGAYKRLVAGHVDYYYGGGAAAWPSKTSVPGTPGADSIPPGMRPGKIFGVWESGILKEYIWNDKNNVGAVGNTTGCVPYGGSGSGSASIKDAVIAPDSTWSSKKISSELNGKVDKVSGKGLSTNDFTNNYKDKLDQYKKLFIGRYPSLSQLENDADVNPGTLGQFAWVGLNTYAWDDTANAGAGGWVLQPDAVQEGFPSDFEVVLSAGKTFGKYTNGQIVPAHTDNHTPASLLMDIARERTPAVYNLPTASLELILSNTDIEVGTDISVEVNPNFVQNDSGGQTALDIKQDGVSIGSADPTTVPSLVLTKTPVEFEATYDYAATDPSNIKKDSLGDDDIDGHFGAGTITVSKSVRGYYKIFYGCTNVDLVQNISQIRVELIDRLTSQGLTNIQFSTSPGKFEYVICPEEYDLTATKDLNTNTAIPLVEVAIIQLPLPDGSTVPYKVFLQDMSNSGGYTASPTFPVHQISLG